MKREDTIGLLGIGMWLLGVLFVVCGLAGVFDLPPGIKANCVTPVAAKAPKVTKAPAAPKPQWGLQEYFPLPTCTGGDLQSTWRVCTPRFYV